MKKINYSILVILIWIAIPLNGNGQNVSSGSIVGDWVFNYEVSMSLTNNDAKSFYAKMDNTQKEKLKGAYRNRKISFGHGGRFSQELSNGQVQQGSWVLDRGNNIIVSNASGSKIHFRIQNLEGNTLVVMPQKADGKSANMLFPKWHLTRI